MSLKNRGSLSYLVVFILIAVCVTACDPGQSVGPQESSGEEDTAVTPGDTLIYQLLDLSEAHGFNVAWDINDEGEIAGGSLLLKANQELTQMGPIFARAINNRGEVAGNSGNEAAIWSRQGGLTKLGMMKNGWSQALDLNNSGNVVGEIIIEHLVYEDEEYGDVYDYEYQAFIWSKQNGLVKINEDGWAAGINDQGFVTGVDYSLPNRAFLWDKQFGLQQIGRQQGFSSANVHSINNNGQITGSVLVTYEDRNELMASSKTTGPNGPSDALHRTDKLLRQSNTKGIYDFGHVKEMILNGTFRDEAFPWKNQTSYKTKYGRNDDTFTLLEPQKQHDLSNALQNLIYRSEAFIWSESDGFSSLGTLGGEWSTGWDINDKGQVVGYSSIGDGKNRAFLWDPDHGMIELPTLGGNSLARSINNKGQIVGYSYDENGAFHPVMWGPENQNIPRSTSDGVHSEAGISQDPMFGILQKKANSTTGSLPSMYFR